MSPGDPGTVPMSPCGPGPPQLFLGHRGCPQGCPQRFLGHPGCPYVLSRPRTPQEIPSGPWATQAMSLSSHGPCPPSQQIPQVLGPPGCPHEPLARVPKGPSVMSPQGPGHHRTSPGASRWSRAQPGEPQRSQLGPGAPGSTQVSPWRPGPCTRSSQVTPRGPRSMGESPRSTQVTPRGVRSSTRSWVHPGRSSEDLDPAEGPSRGAQVHPGHPRSIQELQGPTQGVPWGCEIHAGGPHKGLECARGPPRASPGDPQLSQIQQEPLRRPGPSWCSCVPPCPWLSGHLRDTPRWPLLGRGVRGSEPPWSHVRVPTTRAWWPPQSRSQATSVSPELELCGHHRADPGWPHLCPQSRSSLGAAAAPAGGHSGLSGHSWAQ